MSKRIVILLSSSLLGIIGYAACKPGTDCDFRMCAVDDDGGAQEGAADALVPDVVVPENCDELADAKSPEAAACIDDGFAVFVNAAGGSDTNPGTKAQPLKSLGNAIQKAAGSGKGRIYMCNGAPYEESVKLTTAVSLIGGFTCGTWQYDGAPSKIAPPKSGYALHIDSASGIVVSDIDLTAKSGEADGESSVAVFVNASKVRFVRASLRAGNGKIGRNGDSGTTGKLVSVVNAGNGTSETVLSADGYSGSTVTGGSPKECTCEGSATKTKGGAGGGPGGAGNKGEPDLGKGDAGVVGACFPSGFGGIGENGANAAAASTLGELGELVSTGWQAASGNNGATIGEIGQGGGGGAGATGAGGGGGGCGGCGGLPGKGGQGGGASLALLSVESDLLVIAGKLAAGAGGDGGTGGSGGTGGNGGGGGGGGGGLSCQGGQGGNGGAGSAAGGGAGGLAYGVLYKGPAPSLDPDTLAAITFGEAGKGGTGGKPGKSPDGNDGPAGRSGKVANVNEL